MRRATLLLAAVTAAAAGCGGAGDDAPDGKALFAQTCRGCHTLVAAGARGTTGVDFDRRHVSRDEVLSAIRDGGLGSTLMPKRLLAGADAEAVADYVAEASGSRARSSASAIESPAARKMKAPTATTAAAGAVAPDPATAGAAHADAAFLRASFDSAQDLWRRQFAGAGATYRPGHLVLFHTQVATPCGTQTAQTGPFYCPAAETVYLNTDFFDALARAFELRSGFAAAYVTAHEVGHHVQSQLGVLQRKAQADAADPDGASARSIATELQADCYAGVWLHELAGAGRLGDADLQAIVRAAAVVGDDFQRNAAGRPMEPETWTHGSSEQRVRWLKAGLRSGAPAACDTFGSAAAGAA